MSAAPDAPFEPGSKVRLTEDATNLDAPGGVVRAGTEMVVDAHVPAEESEDGVELYWLTDEGGLGDKAISADKVELVLSPEQMRARKLPTQDEVAKVLGGAMLGAEGLDLDEVDWSSGGGLVTAYGTTADGLGFSVQIQFGTPRKELS